MDPLRPALLKLKYHQDIGLGEALAWDLAVYLDGLGWRADVIIPIPLSEQRLSERGYNQVDMIAHPLARLIGWRYEPKALRRSRHTQSQVELTGAERRKNVIGAFTAETRLINGKTILLVDDITTTGATLHSASASLMAVGADKVYALTFAKAMQKYGSDHAKPISARPLR
jgi:ComF family protein